MRSGIELGEHRIHDHMSSRRSVTVPRATMPWLTQRSRDPGVLPPAGTRLACGSTPADFPTHTCRRPTHRSERRPMAGHYLTVLRLGATRLPGHSNSMSVATALTGTDGYRFVPPWSASCDSSSVSVIAYKRSLPRSATQPIFPGAALWISQPGLTLRMRASRSSSF